MEVSERGRKPDSLIRLLPDKEHDMHGRSESRRQMWRTYMWIYDERGVNGEPRRLVEAVRAGFPTNALSADDLRPKQKFRAVLGEGGDVRRDIFSVWTLDESVVQVIQRLSFIRAHRLLSLS